MELWAYFIDNTSSFVHVNNSELFILIQEANLDDSHIFTDNITGGREELGELLRLVSQDDVVMVRSLVDLADDGTGLLCVLQAFESRGVDVASIEEPWYDYKGAFNKMMGTLKVIDEQREKRRRLGMERAKMAGRMGRRVNKGRREQLQRLRDAGLSVREITELCGISRSTYYRNMTKK